MITTGSVRGKCSDLQFGQSRFQPPSSVALMPAHQRLRHCDRRELLGLDCALHGHAAQLRHGVVLATDQPFRRGLRHAHAEHRVSIAQPKEYRAGVRAAFQRLLDGQQCADALTLTFHQQRVAVDHVGAR
jgi:hypothetical protein